MKYQCHECDEEFTENEGAICPRCGFFICNDPECQESDREWDGVVSQFIGLVKQEQKRKDHYEH